MADGRKISGTFPAPVTVGFSPEVWRQIGRLRKSEFEALQQLIDDLSGRLTLGALAPIGGGRPFEWRFETTDGTRGRCLLDLEQRALTFVEVGRGHGSRGIGATTERR